MSNLEGVRIAVQCKLRPWFHVGRHHYRYIYIQDYHIGTSVVDAVAGHKNSLTLSDEMIDKIIHSDSLDYKLYRALMYAGMGMESSLMVSLKYESE